MTSKAHKSFYGRNFAPIEKVVLLPSFKGIYKGQAHMPGMDGLAYAHNDLRPMRPLIPGEISKSLYMRKFAPIEKVVLSPYFEGIYKDQAHMPGMDGLAYARKDLKPLRSLIPGEVSKSFYGRNFALIEKDVLLPSFEGIYKGQAHMRIREGLTYARNNLKLHVRPLYPLLNPYEHPRG